MGYDKTVFREQTLYFLRGELEDFTRDLPTKTVSSDASDPLILMLVSNCYHDKWGRILYLEELMKYIKIDSFGKCLQTKKLSDVNSFFLFFLKKIINSRN